MLLPLQGNGLFRQVNMIYRYVLMQEYAGCLAESFFALGGEIAARSALRNVALHFGVTLQIIGQRIRHVGALRHDAHSLGHILHYRTHQQRIVCAAENDGVDERILAHELVDALLYEVVGTG